ncbi:MAG: tetratricopeptide repeat protein [Bacteroidales bacterium]|nr:MAG: tetratricopeptide repeat protein [Bacteroidales bacterium]
MVRILLILLISSQAFAQSNIDKAKKLWEAKSNAEAKKILTAIDDESKDYAAAQFYLGRISVDEKNFDDAAEFFEEAVDANDKIAEYHLWLGDTYGTIAQSANMLKQGMLAPKMKSAWEKAVSIDPTLIDARQSLIQFYLQAPSFMGGSIDKAKEMAKEIIKIKPADGHLQMGNIYLKENNPQAAEKEYNEAIKADPTYISILGSFYLNQKQYDKAFAFFEDAVKKNSTDYKSIYQIGKTCALSGQKLDRGEECLKKYLGYTPKKNEPSHAGANMRLAQVYEKQGKKAEAKKLFESAYKTDATLKEAKEGLERLSK